ncbi:FecR domain-containing protein [Methyloversatilis sp.]|uniref:FecR family protein n=1 Tax=Methyloversatilis sp. TaxID=2569862 RepID=UPI003F71CCAB
MTRIFRPVPLALAMAAAFPLTVNADSAARVEFTAGEVRAVAADGRSRPLTRGAQVGSGDTIDTGSGRAQMRFTDGALVSLQPQTQFRIDQYAFAGKPDEDRGFFNLLKGGLRTITGLVGKANRSNYKLTTSVATIGIRGTEFSVAYGNSINVTTGDGAVDVCNGAGCLTVEDGQSAYVADQNTIPVIIEVKTDLPPPPPSNASGGVEPPVRDEVFLVGEERDDDGDLVTLDGLDPQGDLQSGDGYYVYGQYTEQYGGYGGLVTLSGVTTAFEGSALESADSGDGGLLTAGTVVQSAQDGIIGWGRWASASCAGFSCDGDDIVDLHYVTGRATPDLAALGGISATYSLSGATTPTSSGGAPGGAVSGTLLADFTSYTADLDLGVTVSAVTFNVSGSGSINSGTAAFAGSFDSCSGCGSTPNGSFHGFFAGPSAERAGVVYSFDSAINGIDKVTGAAVFTRGVSGLDN